MMGIGDLHLGCQINYIPNLYKLQIKNLQACVALAIDHGIEHIWLLGDIFDAPHPPRHIQIALLKFMNKNPDVHFHIIVGNHDWESSEHHALMLTKSITGLFPTNYTVYEKPQVVTIDGMEIFVCSHPNVLDRPNKSVSWCLGHFAWNGAKGDNGYKVETKFSPKGKWILGDFHTHQSTSRYVYAGSLHPVTWHEGEDKGVLIFDEDDWMWHKIEGCYSLNTMHLSSDEDLRKIHTKGHNYWSLKTESGYTIPNEIKEKYPNIVHITASNKKKTTAQKVLLDTRDTAVNDPLKKLPEFLAASKLSLTNKEIAWALKQATIIKNKVLR